MSSRFQLSFPGRRGHDDPWFRVGTLDVNTTRLVSLLLVVSLFVRAISIEMASRLVLIPGEVTSGQIWRVVTWPFAQSVISIWSVITIAMFWIFGNELERLTGRVRWAWFLFALVVLSGLAGVALDLVQFGFRPIEFVVLLVFIGEYPTVRFFFNIPAWALGAVFLGIEVLSLVGDRNSDGLLFLLVTLVIGAVGARSIGLLQAYPFIPRLPFGSGGGRRRERARSASRGRGRGRTRDFDTVVTGPWTGPSPADQREMDQLLDKMNSSGLTDAERRRLTELGRRLREGR